MHCQGDGLFGKLGWRWCRNSRNSLLYKGRVKQLIFKVQMLAMHMDIGNCRDLLLFMVAVTRRQCT